MQIWLMLFLGFFTIIAALGYIVIRILERRQAQRLEKLLASVDPDEPKVTTTVAIQAPPERNRQLEKALQNTPGLGWVPAAARLTGGRWDVARVLAASAGLGAAGFFAGATLAASMGIGAAVAGGLIMAAIPFLYLRRQKARVLRAFEEQLPDAIDFLARSVRTGNAFSITLELLIPETTEPLRSEFRKVSSELALGSPLDEALKNLVARVPLLELRFFVAAVLLQRETGGNLAETLNKLSHSIRERLRLKGQIKASSSQGRLTARVLSVLPVVVVVIMNVISPAYFRTMTGEAVGRLMLIAAVVSQLVGYLFMRKITDIEV